MDDINPEDYPTLVQVGRFARLIAGISWFRNIGEPLSNDVRELARAYGDALGFPGADVAQIYDWDEAAATLETHDLNSPAWEAEEQLLSALHHQALDILDPQMLEVALTHVNSQASDAITERVMSAADLWGIEDEELLRASIGTAIHACYQAALVVAAGESEDHPFALKFRLFEKGWWPLGIVGNTLNIF
ncbi:hypothetical protein [Luteithermobacter gelatinilyticus]|uniref:hypothetical protein n=1 Tax=Luteithermobacter gelatinilyticus TaxID=2582913 RepID=UPI001106341C|nr:hypothetical protein [Luteithermobacter gelatinilyticus]